MSGVVAYDQARADFEQLEELAEVDDMVTIDASMIDLMRDPTRRKAAEIYVAAIRLWFDEHGPDFECDPDVSEIADRHGLA